jgi:hypothetical protein
MNVTKLSAAVLAVLVVRTGVGAVAATLGNGNVPDDSGAMADTRDASDAETPRSEAAPVWAADAQERRGPPADFPGQVPATSPRSTSESSPSSTVNWTTSVPRSAT